MSRSARLAATAATAALVAAAPSTAPAAAPPAASSAHQAGAGVAARAAKAYAVLTKKVRRSDDVLRAVGAKQRKLPRGAKARLVASGKGYRAFLVAGAQVAGGVRPSSGLQLVLIDGGKVAAATTTLQAAAVDGAGLAQHRADGTYLTVAVLPNGSTGVTITTEGKVRALPLRRNAVAAVTKDAGSLAFTASNGSVRTVPVTGDSPQTMPQPVTATLLEGSHITLDLGNGVKRDVPLSGTVSAALPNGYLLARTNTFVFKSADLHVGATDLLTDDCAGPALARLNPATGVVLDPKASSGSLAPTGEFRVSAAVALRTVLDVRGSGGCGAPAATSGYADTGALSFSLAGKLGSGSSLARFQLASAPTAVTVNGCLAAGDPAKPCTQAATAVSATATLSLVVSLQIGTAPIPAA